MFIFFIHSFIGKNCQKCWHVIFGAQMQTVHTVRLFLPFDCFCIEWLLVCRFKRKGIFNNFFVLLCPIERCLFGIFCVFWSSKDVIRKKNFAWWYYSFSCSYHFQWPWPCSEGTTMSNSFNWKFYVLILLSWSFIGLLSKSRR